MRIKKTCSEKWNLNIGRYKKPCRTEFMDAVPRSVNVIPMAFEYELPFTLSI